MQIRLTLVFLGFIGLMFALAGCGSNSNSLTSTTNATVIKGKIWTASNTPVTTTQMYFYLNGSEVSGSPVSGNNGIVGSNGLVADPVGFSYGISPGTYTVELTGSLANETTFLGTLTVGGSSQTLNIITPTALSQLPGTVTQPTDGTATLVVQSVNSSGALIDQPFSVAVGSLSGTSTSNGTTSYLVIPEVPVTTSISATVTPTGGTATTVTNLAFAANTVVLLNAVL